MNGSCLLDTNIVIAVIAREKEVLIKVRQAEKIFIPSIVVGELFYGAYNSVRQEENISRIMELTLTNAILDCNTESADQYGQIKHHLKLKGHPIPENDIWIAAIAKQYDLILVSRDNHFQEIDNLKVEIW